MTMANTAPFEIIGAPFEIWTAPVNEAMPDLDTTPPGGNWTQIGTNGVLSFAEQGLTIEHPQSHNFFRSLGSAGPRKVFRESEDFIIRGTVADLTLEVYTLLLSNATPTEVSAGVGTLGHKSIAIERGTTIPTSALLVRGPSPYMDQGLMQYEVPLATFTGSTEVPLRRSEQAEYDLEWTALVDPTSGFGTVRASHEAALP